MNKTTRVLISTFGGLVGAIGVEHGVGEVLQGNIAPEGLMILSWPGSAFFKTLGGEPAMTILPNLLVTGILAILFSLVYAAWVTLFAQHRHSSRVLILLSILMLLFGGGIFPPVFGIVIAAAARGINAPLTWWQAHLSTGVRGVLETVWPWSFAACLLAWLGMFPGLPALDYFFGVGSEILILVLLAGMFGFLALAAVAGFARDIREQAGTILHA